MTWKYVIKIFIRWTEILAIRRHRKYLRASFECGVSADSSGWNTPSYNRTKPVKRCINFEDLVVSAENVNLPRVWYSCHRPEEKWSTTFIHMLQRRSSKDTCLPEMGEGKLLSGRTVLTNTDCWSITADTGTTKRALDSSDYIQEVTLIHFNTMGTLGNPFVKQIIMDLYCW